MGPGRVAGATRCDAGPNTRLSRLPRPLADAVSRGATGSSLTVTGPSGWVRSVGRVQRVAVIGCGGAGKTTLANELGRRLHLPVLHVDGFYWQDRPGIGRVESTPKQWRQIHDEMITGPRWVIDGMKLGVLEARLAAADTAVFLDLPAWACLLGVVRRRLRYRGQLRADIGVYDRINVEFVRWILSFRRAARPRILELLRVSSCQVVVLHSHAEARAFLESLPRRTATVSA
jgi:adenylate kinase family enzyme